MFPTVVPVDLACRHLKEWGGTTVGVCSFSRDFENSFHVATAEPDFFHGPVRNATPSSPMLLSFDISL